MVQHPLASFLPSGEKNKMSKETHPCLPDRQAYTPLDRGEIQLRRVQIQRWLIRKTFESLPFQLIKRGRRW